MPNPTRQQLIDGTLETIRRHGIAATSARTIAATAGLNQALICYHFGSMHAILRSRHEAELLTVLLLHPDRAYTLTDLAVLLKVPASTLSGSPDVRTFTKRLSGRQIGSPSPSTPRSARPLAGRRRRTPPASPGVRHASGDRAGGWSMSRCSRGEAQIEQQLRAGELQVVRGGLADGEPWLAKAARAVIQEASDAGVFVFEALHES